MSNIFIIHGSYGYPGENWFPWLKTKLEELGHRVFVPKFQVPKGEDPKYGGHNLSKWFATMNEYKQYINENTTLIGHSRGCIFIFRLLEQLQTPVKAVFLVGPWISRWSKPTGWKNVDSFHETPFQWQQIRKNSNYFEIYQSTNDEIPVTEGTEVARSLGGTLQLVKNAGHFNIARDPKYKTFELLLENIKKKL